MSRRPVTIDGSPSAGRVAVAALRGRPGALARLIGWSVPETLPVLVSGYALARAVDDGFLADRPLVGFGWLALIAGAVLIGAVGTRYAYRCLADLVEPFRDELVRRVVTGAMRHGTAAGPRADADSGSVARLTHQVEIVRDTFAGLVMTVRAFGFAAAAALLGLASLSPVVLALVLPPLVIGLALFGAALPAMVVRQREYTLAGERLAGSAGEAFGGLRDVAACRAEERVSVTIGKHVDAQAAAERSLARMSALRTVTVAVSGWLPVALLLATGPWLVRRGVTAGGILGALAYLLYVLQPALHTLVRGVGGGGLRFVVTLDRILRASDPLPAQNSPRSPVCAPPGDLVLRGVTFRYGRHAAPVIDRLDLTIAADEYLAVVGPSGIGKSTLAELICGRLEPDSGQVWLGDVPLQLLPRAVLAGQRVLIPQEAYVFTATLWDNLTYLRPDASQRLVDGAVDALGLGALAARLGGYRAVVDPRALSAGERQLIALTRAYLSPARLAVLDEATCHLDPESEARAEAAFARRPGALVLIAHRVSTAQRARRVLVLDGTTATLGSHDAVLTRSPLYRDLVGRWTGGAEPIPEHAS
jgi:ATP-binding cassette subfamily C protein